MSTKDINFLIAILLDLLPKCEMRFDCERIVKIIKYLVVKLNTSKEGDNNV